MSHGDRLTRLPDGYRVIARTDNAPIAAVRSGTIDATFRASGDTRTPFAILAVSFWILAIQRLLVALSVSVFESEAYLYGIRLLAYVLILYAIIDKNRNDPKVRDRA